MRGYDKKNKTRRNLFLFHLIIILIIKIKLSFILLGMGTSQSKTEQFKQPLRKILEEKLSIYLPLDTQDIKTKCRKPTKLAPQTCQKVNLNAKPVEQTNQDQVDTSDGRVQVLTASQWPYSVHGLVAVKSNLLRTKKKFLRRKIWKNFFSH